MIDQPRQPRNGIEREQARLNAAIVAVDSEQLIPVACPDCRATNGRAVQHPAATEQTVCGCCLGFRFVYFPAVLIGWPVAVRSEGGMNANTPPAKKYWYRIYVGSCPSCGRDKGYRERVYGPRPSDASQRYIQMDEQETYDYCDY